MAPPELEFLAEAPTISAQDLDIIKLTAQFVARNGNQFLQELLQKEVNNYQFDFLKPQHMLFHYFTQVTEQYRKIFMPRSTTKEMLEKSAKSVYNVIGRVTRAAAWSRAEKKRKEAMAEADDAEKSAYPAQCAVCICIFRSHPSFLHFQRHIRRLTGTTLRLSQPSSLRLQTRVSCTQFAGTHSHTHTPHSRCCRPASSHYARGAWRACGAVGQGRAREAAALGCRASCRHPCAGRARGDGGGGACRKNTHTHTHTHTLTLTHSLTRFAHSCMLFLSRRMSQRHKLMLFPCRRRIPT